jgi:hypothetical protein
LQAGYQYRVQEAYEDHVVQELGAEKTKSQTMKADKKLAG